MPTIKGFTTQKPIIPQLVKAGAELKTKFKFITDDKVEAKTEKNPLKGLTIKTYDNETQEIKEV